MMARFVDPSTTKHQPHDRDLPRTHAWIMLMLSCTLLFVKGFVTVGADIVVTPTTLTTTTSTSSGLQDACIGVSQCLADVMCQQCLTTINTSIAVHTMSDLDTIAASPQSLRSFQSQGFHVLASNVPCWRMFNTTDAAIGLLEVALTELTVPSCVDAFGMATDACVVSQLPCLVDSNCRACISLLLNRTESITKLDVLQSPACVASPPSLISQLQMPGRCVFFPSCTFFKEQCRNTSECQVCLTFLVEGNGAMAARQCSGLGPAAVMMDNIVTSCAQVDDTSCAFMQQRCADDSACSGCLATISNGFDALAIATEYASPECARASTDGAAIHYLDSIAFACPQISACRRTVAECVFTHPDLCVSCIMGQPAEKNNTNCTTLMNFYDFDSMCLGCPGSVQVINQLVLTTAVVGGISVVVCLTVIFTIFAHERDRASLRDRIVVGLMTANAVYSSANTIPLSALYSDSLNCGRLVLTFDDIRFGRAWWFAGKYGLVSFELLIIAASIGALMRSTAVMPRQTEAVLHSVCCAVAIIAFLVFYTRCAHINAAGYNMNTEDLALTGSYNHISDDGDDDEPGVAATNQLQNGREQYDNLVRNMLVAWDVLVGLAVVLWMTLRVAYTQILRSLDADVATAERAEIADEWAATRRSTWKARFHLFDARRAAFAEIAKPLEPYIAVFVLFAAPAVVMSTSYCQKHSGAETTGDAAVIDTVRSSITYGTCDVWCEFILSFRTLGAVFVYLAPRQRRAELVDLRGTWSRLWARVSRSCFPCAFVSLRRRTNFDDKDEGDALISLNSCHTPHGTDINRSSLDMLWKISESDIITIRQIGRGASGDVWEGRLKPHDCVVAVKLLIAGAVDEDGDFVDPNADEDFQRECAALQNINSAHLLRFFGFGTSLSGRAFIVTELLSGGSLERVLHDQGIELHWRTRISIGLQVALGMEHLHFKCMLHRDLKSANVLLDEQLNIAKVCDFGLARVIRPRASHHLLISTFTGLVQRLSSDGSAEGDARTASADIGRTAIYTMGARGVLTKAAGTLLWMAPEVFRGDDNYGPAVDVYSFGIVLWELSSRTVPWTELDVETADGGHVSETMFFAALNRALQSGRRPLISSEVVAAFPGYVEVMRKCWQGDPADRPTFSAVVPMLAACLRGLDI